MKDKKRVIKATSKAKPVAAILNIIVIALLLAIFYSASHDANKNNYSCANCASNLTNQNLPNNLYNINNTDVKNATGHNYLTISSNEIMVPSSYLKSQGFDYISTSAFNYTGFIPQNAPYPQTIVAVVYVTKNLTVANQTINGA